MQTIKASLDHCLTVNKKLLSKKEISVIEYNKACASIETLMDAMVINYITNNGPLPHNLVELISDTANLIKFYTLHQRANLADEIKAAFHLFIPASADNNTESNTQNPSERVVELSDEPDFSEVDSEFSPTFQAN
tara:strand:- start:1624 stop:2028 length:405 start_codon:yes stop_codon:yes gene_type:complete